MSFNKKMAMWSLFILGLAIILPLIANASSFVTNSQTTFNQGSYANTFYNNTGFVQLNKSQSNGGYTSKVFDAGFPSIWNTISLTQGMCYGCELPNNNSAETGFVNNSRMNGNLLLVHFDNISASGESSTFYKDWSILGNNGVCLNTQCPKLFSPGKYNKSYDFDGSNDFVNFSNPSSLNNIGNQLTLEAWINADSFSGFPSIIEKNYLESFAMYFTGGNLNVDLITSGGDEFITGTGSFSTGQWYHIGFTYNGSQMRLYRNGVLDGSPKSASGTIQNSNKALLIGAGWDGNSPGFFFNGRIDEAAIYNRSLSADEMMDRYLRGVLRLNISVRSCDDALCSGESVTTLNGTPIQTLNLNNNRYFQYSLNFSTENVTFSPKFNNGTIEYSVININSSIALNSPADDATINTNSSLLNFTVYDNNLDNMTVWIYGNNLLLNTSYNLTNGTQTTYNWTGLSDGIYSWQVVSNDGNANTTSVLYQFVVNLTPTIQSNSSSSSSSSNSPGPGNNAYYDSQASSNNADENDVSQSSNKKEVPKKETKKKTVLFDINFQIDPKSKVVSSGTDILVTVGLVNFGDPGKVITTVVYTVKNNQGNVIYEFAEEVPVETQNEFVKSLAIPRELEEGEYIIGVTLKYGDGQEAYSEDTFSVEKAKRAERSYEWLGKIILGIGVLLIVSLLAYMLMHNRVFSRIIDNARKIDFTPKKNLAAETIQKQKLVVQDSISKKQYYEHEETNSLVASQPQKINKETVRERLERLQEQNFRRTVVEPRKKGGFHEPVKHVETYLYPHEKETIKARIERLRKKTESYKPLVKETIKPGKKTKTGEKIPPPKSIEDLGIDDL